jgi:hypothetical protein
MKRRVRRYLKELAHRRGWIASPSLAFMGVPFGPDRRDLASEVMQAVARSHDEAGDCPICHPDTAPQERPMERRKTYCDGRLVKVIDQVDVTVGDGIREYMDGRWRWFLDGQEVNPDQASAFRSHWHALHP